MNASLNGHAGRLLALAPLFVVLACTGHAQAVTPRQLVETSDISDITMSPDGRRVAFRVQQAVIERNALDTTWYVQDVDGKVPPRRVADGGFAIHEFFGGPAPAPAVWSPDGRWIYYRAIINEKIDVWRAATDGSRSEPITLDPADVRDFFLSADGATLTYSVGATRDEELAAEQAEQDHGVRINKSAPIGQPLFRSGYIEGRLSTQRYRGGMELNRASLLAEVPDQWKAIDLATGLRRDIASSDAPRHPAAAFSLPQDQAEPFDLAVDPQKDRAAVLTSSGDGQGLYRQPHATLTVLTGRRSQQPVQCVAEPCESKPITRVQWRPGHDEVVFTVTDRDEGSAQSIFRWKVGTDVVHPVVRSRGLVNGGRNERSPCAVSAQALVCVAAEADRPPRLERIDLETGQRHVLFEPNAALALDIAKNPRARLLRWQDASGQTFAGHFFPARRGGDDLPPLFVSYYTCSGFLRGGLGDEWPLASLAQKGISTLCINHAPLRLDAVERYDAGTAAVASAVDLLASRGEIDRSKVGMGGLSLGTEVTLWTVVNSGLLTAASVSSVTPTPMGYAQRRLYDDSFLPALRKFWQLGAPEETPERWKRLSIAFNLDAIHAPILMQIPEQEYIRSLQYAAPLMEDHRAELYAFPNEAHVKFQPRHKLAIYERNLDWFRFWLQGVEDADPSKAAQYPHWHVMRERSCQRTTAEGETPPWYCPSPRRR